MGITDVIVFICFERAGQSKKPEIEQSARSFQYMCVDSLRWEMSVAVTSRKWRRSSHLTPSQQLVEGGWYMAKIINVLTGQTHVDKSCPLVWNREKSLRSH